MLLATSALACGYTVNTHVAGDGAEDLGRNVAIVPFQNRVTIFERRPGVEQRLHEALLDAVLPSPYTLVPSDDADLVVTGELDRLRQQTLSHTPDGNVSEVQVGMRVHVRVESRRTGEEWEETIHERDVFAVDGGETLEQTEARVFRALADEILRRFVHPDHRW